MMRLAIRLSFVAGLVGILLLIVIARFWVIGRHGSAWYAGAFTSGIGYTWWPPSVLVTFDPKPHSWSLGTMFPAPIFGEVSMGIKAVFIPWWLLLVTWGLLTALVWRFTRSRKLQPAFPVEVKAGVE